MRVDHDGLLICGVHIGLVSAVYELGLFVFAQSGMFCDIGDAAAETSPTLPPDATLSFWIADRVRAGEGQGGRAVGAELVPRNGQRQMMALFLALLMLRFVWLHELFHGLNGHAGLRASQRRGLALHENADDAALAFVEIERVETPGTVDDSHGMEFDADRSAFWAMMRRQMDGVEPVAGIGAGPGFLACCLA